MMPISQKTFTDLQFDDLNDLILNGVPEGLRIEYKREPYASTENKEFLKDFSSFANTQGGCLLIGIEEKNGIPISIFGILNSEVDGQIQRMESLMRDGIEPRVIGATVRPIRIDSNKSVVAVQIPHSLNPPHRVIAQGLNKFIVRNSNGKHEASVEELRHLFGFAARLSNDIQEFVRGRRSQIISDQDFLQDHSNGRLIIHIVNAPTFRDITFIDIGALYRDPYRFAPMDAHSLSKRVTLEGIVVGPESGGKFFDRTLIFRDGAVETVYSGILRTHNTETLIPGKHVMDCILHSVESGFKGIIDLGATGPFILNVALQTQKGVGIAFYNDPLGSYPKFDREFVELPALTITECVSETSALPMALRPLLDGLWNAVGLPNCGYFHADMWQPPR